MTKAWKILHHLRGVYSGQNDETIAQWLQLCDDRQWEIIAKAVGLKPATGWRKPVEKGGTSCYVSREVKAIVFTNLRSKGLSRPTRRGADALNPIRTIKE